MWGVRSNGICATVNMAPLEHWLHSLITDFQIYVSDQM